MLFYKQILEGEKKYFSFHQDMIPCKANIINMYISLFLFFFADGQHLFRELKEFRALSGKLENMENIIGEKYTSIMFRKFPALIVLTILLVRTSLPPPPLRSYWLVFSKR